MQSFIRIAGKVDSSGQLPSGGEFSNVNEFRKLLQKGSHRLAENLVHQLAIYATGSGYRFTQRPMTTEITERVADREHGVRSLIESLCTSDLFLQR